LHALYRASTYALRVTCGREATRLLIESDRIQGDLEQHAKGEIDAEFNLVVREFRTFDPDLEFRGFVYKGKFTALSQYNEFVHFPLLANRKDDILQQISHQFQTKIFPALPMQNCVVDFVLCAPTEAQYTTSKDRYSNLLVYVVELNPLAEFASSGLFTWEKDKPVLLGQAPFEFRILEAVPQFPFANLPPVWQKFCRPQE